MVCPGDGTAGYSKDAVDREAGGGGGGGTCQQKSNNCPRDFDAVRYASKLMLDDAIAPRNSLPIRGSGGANHGRSQSKKGAHAERLEKKIETKKRTTLKRPPFGARHCILAKFHRRRNTCSWRSKGLLVGRPG